MSRRPDPARIEAAKRAATLQRLIGAGLLPERAAAALAAWEAAQDGPERDWEAGYRAIAAQRR